MDQVSTILASAEKLFMRYGIRSVSMDDIAKELGMSKKTLYQYVENKGDLIESIFENRIDSEKCDMADIIAGAEDAVQEMVQIGNYVIEKLRQLSPNIMFDLQKYYPGTWKKMESLQLKHVYSLIYKNILRGKEEGVYRSNIDPDIVAKLYVAKTSMVVDQDLFPVHQYNMEKLFRQYISYHLHGILSSRGLELMALHLDQEFDDVD